MCVTCLHAQLLAQHICKLHRTQAVQAGRHERLVISHRTAHHLQRILNQGGKGIADEE